MTVVTKIFSALGNNSSLTPIIVKDGFDISGRTAMAYNQGQKAGKQYAVHDAREMLLEETVTSSVWLGGIPALKLLFNKFITNKAYNFKKLEKYGKDALANLDLKLLDKNSPQALKLENIKDKALKVEVEKILKDKSKYKKFFASKATVATIIPLALIGFVLPKINYALTGKIVKEEKAKAQKKAFKNLQNQQVNIAQKHQTFSAFMGNYNKQEVAFGSLGELGELTAKVFMNPVSNMAILDAGISSGRLATSRNKFEAIEKGIKEAGIITFMYLGGPHIAKGLEWVSNKLFKTPISLDSKILENKEFLKDITSATKDKQFQAQMIKFAEVQNEKNIINFIDEELKANGGKIKNHTLKAAQELDMIDIVDGARNPLKHIDTEKLTTLNTQIKDFIKKASQSGNVEKFVKKSKYLKRSMIVANIALCSTALAYVLPKIQYWFREKYTNSSAAPGLKDYYQ